MRSKFTTFKVHVHVEYWIVISVHSALNLSCTVFSEAGCQSLYKSLKVQYFEYLGHVSEIPKQISKKKNH